MIEVLFYILSTITLGTALLTIFSRNPIHSAIYLVICFFSIAGHYLMLNVPKQVDVFHSSVSVFNSV